MKILITGGAGFIGSAFIKYLIAETAHQVINVDKLTYAGSLQSLSNIVADDRYVFQQADICDYQTIKRIFAMYRPDLVVHLAAESHVDRSIDGPAPFIQSNIVGSYTLLEVAREYWESLSTEGQRGFRFHYVSTDEVFGDLQDEDEPFSELSGYAPSSPYSASKASADHLVRAWSRTYGLPVLITSCTNNYGPFQFPEKLIPLIIQRARLGMQLPVYGDGKQVRDWIHVDDHIRALYRVLMHAPVNSFYTIGADNQVQNIELVESICRTLDKAIVSKPKGIKQFSALITHVADRAGHDRRYAVDATKIRHELGWRPSILFKTGLERTIQWYLDHPDWSSVEVENVTTLGKLQYSSEVCG